MKQQGGFSSSTRIEIKPIERVLFFHATARGEHFLEMKHEKLQSSQTRHGDKYFKQLKVSFYTKSCIPWYYL